jgi:hypothetical protein
VAHNNVIEKLDLHGFCRFSQLASYLNIGCAWRWITAGMIVHADDGSGPVANCLAKNFPRMS